MKEDFDLIKEADKECDMRQKWVRQSFETRQKIAPFAKLIKALLRVSRPDITVEYYSSCIKIAMPVKDMKETVPFIESLQDIIGHEFGQTSDETTYSMARTFKMADFPLELIARVSSEDETANCKIVKVGEQIVPIMKIQCEDGDGIPF